MRLLLLALLLAPLAAQQPLPQEAPAAKFQASAQLVVEIVSVKDKNGKVIEGLTAKDFTVTENGAPQTIRFCEFQKVQDTADPTSMAAALAPATDIAKVESVTRNQISGETPGDIRYQNRRLL